MKILLVDDHDLFREGLKLILRRLDRDIELLEADCFAEAVRLVEAGPALDLILLDLKMPGVDSMSGLADLRERAGETPVVIISGAYVQSDISAAFQNGAAGFIPKTMGSKAMFSAINLVLSGEKFVPSLAFLGEDAALPPGSQAAPQQTEGFADLTPRQHDVLSLLVQGMSNREIADTLGLQEVSVRARLTGIFKKLGVKNRMQAASLAIRQGYPG